MAPFEVGLAGGAEYVGCFKIRNAADERLAQRSHRWYDPHHKVFLGDDTRYAEGPFYVIQGRVIEGIMRSGLLPRAGGPEGARPHPAWHLCMLQVGFCATMSLVGMHVEQVETEQGPAAAATRGSGLSSCSQRRDAVRLLLALEP